MSPEPGTDGLRPMTEIQVRQTREFVESLAALSLPYWDMVTIGDELSRDLHPTPELVIAGATVRVHTRAVDKFEKRGRRYVRHEATVTDVDTGTLYFTEIRDILSR